MSLTPRQRPKITNGHTEKVKTGCGNLYVTVNRDSEGICEVFGTLGKTGGCAAAQIEAIGRLVSQCLRCGMDIEVLITELEGIRCPSPVFDGKEEVTSCADAIARVLKHEANGENPS